MVANPSTPQGSLKVMMDNLTIMLYGHTGAGKTALIGELAEHYFATQKKKTRLYTSDRGGWITIAPYVELGVIEVIPLFDDPWIWLGHAVKGDTLKDGNWVPGTRPDIALYAFEGMTSTADAVMSWMAQASGRGVNIGGGGAMNFTVTQGKETLKIGTNNMAHYGVAQQQVYEKATESQYLPGTVLWTAGDKRGEDDAIGGVVGPQVAGKALTSEVPRWFKYTLRVATEVMAGQAPKHVLYLEDHIEMNARMAKAMVNARVPLAGGGEGGVTIPSRIEPASLVQFLTMMQERQASAKSAIAKRLGL